MIAKPSRVKKIGKAPANPFTALEVRCGADGYQT